MNVPLKYKLFAILLVLIGVFLYGRCGGKRALTNPVSPVKVTLPMEDTEQILVNPVKHTITIVKPSSSITTTLPERTSTIDIHKDGTVKVTAMQFGYEVRPFVGVTYTDGLRFGGGADLYYFKRLDLGVGASWASGIKGNAFAKISYNVFDNLSLGLIYDNNQHIGGCITVRI